MKIGILTQPLLNNYGGILQNFALQQVLKQAGHDVETIDHCSNPPSKLTIFFSDLKTLFLKLIFKDNNRSFLNYYPSKEELNIIREHTIYFIEKYIKRTNVSHNIDELVAEAKKANYEGYIVGSDQCWRPYYNGWALPAMFLNFAYKSEDIRRIAYAVSLGVDEWEYDKVQTCYYSKLAQKFDCISVREKSAEVLISKHFSVKATLVLDPTMLLLKTDYIKLIEEENESVSEGDLFTYILDPSENKAKFIKKIGDCLGYKPFCVQPFYREEYRRKKHVKNEITRCVYPPVTKWLRAFMDAKMIVVDSFHGMVFSIIFNKPFWVINNKQRGTSRFVSLLNLFSLEDRLLDEDMLTTCNVEKQIDWHKVNSILQEKRILSLNFLLNALKK